MFNLIKSTSGFNGSVLGVCWMLTGICMVIIHFQSKIVMNIVGSVFLNDEYRISFGRSFIGECAGFVDFLLSLFLFN